MAITGTFTDSVQNSIPVYLQPGDSMTFALAPNTDFIGTAVIEKSADLVAWSVITSISGTDAVPNTAGATGTVKNEGSLPYYVRATCSDYDDADSDNLLYTLTEVENVNKLATLENGVILGKSGAPLFRVFENGIEITTLRTATASLNSDVGTVNSPTSGTTAVTIKQIGDFFSLTFTLTAARIPVTDGAASGSYGSLKLFDFAEGGVSFLGCRQNYTAYSEDGTGVPNDIVFEIGVGTVAIAAAADGTLGTTNKNVGAAVSQTLSSGTTTGTAFTGAGTAVDGTATASDLYLNFSGTAATVDGNGYLNVTGTITVIGSFLGDD